MLEWSQRQAASAPFLRYWVSGFLADIGDGRDKVGAQAGSRMNGRSQGLASLLVS
jgi:hypothetical protein